MISPVALFLALLAYGCASEPMRQPDHRPEPPGPIRAHLNAFPPITISGRPVTLVAWLDDPQATVRCPSVTWEWPNGTRSSRTSDCEPDEAVTRHQDIKRGVPAAGEFEVRVAFASAGKEWRASTVVHVQ